MLKIAVGHSNDPDSLEAIKEVLKQCHQDLAGQIPQVGILLTAFDFEHSLILETIGAAFPKLQLIGGTTDGELSSVLGFQQDSVTLMLLASDDVEFQAGVARHVSQNPVEITHQAVVHAQTQLASLPQLCIAVPESLTASADDILQGLKTALGTVPILGGAAADQAQMKCTYQFFNHEVLQDAVPFLLLGGNLKFSYGVASGWSPIGKRSQITKADKNTIYEIDGRPALDFYHYYLNDFVPSAAYPLAVFPAGEETFFLRGSLTHNAAIGSITVSGDVPANATVQITEASLDNIITASKFAFTDALDRYPGEQPEAALFFSCSWRRYVLGTRTKEEYKEIISTLDTALPSCGFYTFGELAPLRVGGPTVFHNTTFTTLLLGTN